jgi:predicted ABC-type transport system involved in lysophospholipase L1 biosynthesis ATPase subunit
VLASILDFARGRILVVATHDPAVAARMAMQWRVGADGEVSA